MGKKLTDNRTNKIVFVGTREECISYRSKLKLSEQPFYALTDKQEGDEVFSEAKKETEQPKVETPKVEETKSVEEKSNRTKITFVVDDVEGQEGVHSLTVSIKESNNDKVESKQTISTEEKETLLNTVNQILVLYSKDK